MKNLAVIILIFFVSGISLTARSQSLDVIKNIRNELFYTDFNFNKCEKYYNYIVSLNDKSPLIQAYQAAAESLMAKHSWNPLNKFSYLKNAQELLNDAVKADEENPEIRFLRLYIQRSIPSYMGMSGDIAEDKAAILTHLDKLNVEELGRDIATYIATYMAATDLTTAPEASLIKEKLEVN
ncbi:hypothetical protein JMN32_09665 [Fulvivirga sp. 29W222]|uniref:Uncharacterized protein n=1 Tax=Fulvivirga marina TaxID=2494733 RepID=A0A937FXJ5_9BACT|nr:hypothetical protein [Fulvivirga marina]MBL6446577.1 hypothetical protein [Fulvivirga marina]